MQTQIIEINGKSLTIDLIHYVATHNDVKVTISEEVKKKIAKSRELVEKKVENQEVVYGLTTGFGEFKNKTISKEQTEELQKNLIISHSIGTGEAFKEEIIRAATLVRANSLVNGFSGIRLSTIEAMLDIINHNVYAYVPSKGSVGASGDLAPLSHLVACRMGYGEAYKGGKRIDSKIYLQEIGLSPLVLSSKEGLALNNGTSFMAGISALNLYKAEKLIKLSDIAYSMTLEACMGTVTACDHKVHDCRPHNGQIRTAENVRRLCNSSEIMESHKNCGRVQDSYSLRCTPQVHGAVKDSYNHVKSVIVTEINSTTDNPLVFPDDDQVISAGNFHGEPIALVMDFLGIAISELANISDRRIFKMLSPHLSEGLPAFLIDEDKGGLNNGLMIAQYTTAALLAENKVLAHPASVDSIPTSADQEDHVSMGMTSSNKATQILSNVEDVLSVELMCAAQALDYKAPNAPGIGSKEAYKTVREKLSHLDNDRVLYKDLEITKELLSDIITNVEKRIGEIQI